MAIFAFWYARSTNQATIKDAGQAAGQDARGRRASRLDKTLAAQREQLDSALAAQRTRTLNERFATAAGQLGSDKPAAVRLAGVHAMAGLADDWPENRQTCVDVLRGRTPQQFAAMIATKLATIAIAVRDGGSGEPNGEPTEAGVRRHAATSADGRSS